jgi:probable rRNA maturation factor
VVKNLKVNCSLPLSFKKGLIHNVVANLKRDLKFDISSLFINFINAEEIKEINTDYLNHKYSTDIITFNYSGSNSLLDGELYISVDDAKYFAGKYKVSLKEEIVRLVIHGILHLLNYDDHTKNDKFVMKQMENKLLNNYKIALLNKK